MIAAPKKTRKAASIGVTGGKELKRTIVLAASLLLSAPLPAYAVEESVVCLRIAQNKEDSCKYRCQSSYNEDAKSHCDYKCSQDRSAEIKACNAMFGHSAVKAAEPVDVAKPE